jgi:hypothetical protein
VAGVHNKASGDILVHWNHHVVVMKKLEFFENQQFFNDCSELPFSGFPDLHIP